MALQERDFDIIVVGCGCAGAIAAYVAAKKGKSVLVVERAFTLEQLEDADEVIVTSSSHLCTFANEFDGKPVGGKDPVTLGKLRRSVYGEFRDYMGADPLFTLN